MFGVNPRGAGPQDQTPTLLHYRETGKIVTTLSRGAVTHDRIQYSGEGRPRSIKTPPRDHVLCLPNCHPELVRFVHLSSSYKNDIEQKLAKNDARIMWPKHGCVLKVENTRTQGQGQDSDSKVTSWEVSVRDVIDKVTQPLVVDESIHCPIELSRELISALAKYPEFNLGVVEKVALFIGDFNQSLLIVGEKKEVESFKQRLLSVIGHVKVDHGLPLEQVTKRITLRPHERRILDNDRFFQRFEKQFSPVTISYESSEVEKGGVLILLCGPERDVDGILFNIRKLLREQIHSCLSLPYICAELVKQEKTRQFLDECLKKGKSTCTWYLTEENDVVIAGKSEETVDEARYLISRNIGLMTIEFSEERSRFFQTDFGRAELEKITEKWFEKSLFWEEKDSIAVAATREALPAIRNELIKVIDHHGVFAKFVPLQLGFLCCLTTHMQSQLADWMERCSEQSVTVVEVRGQTRAGFLITGQLRGRRLAVQGLIDLVVQISQGRWRGVGANCSFLFREAKSKIQETEQKCKCILDFQGRDLDTLKTTGFKIKIQVIQGELAKQSADVIVNPTNQNLDLSQGRISQSLLTAGGEAIQQDCRRKYPDGILISQVAETCPGSLSCRAVYHGALVPWDGGAGTAEQVMMVFIMKCLRQAEESKMKSLAFPPIGTSDLGYPPKFVARLMFDTIEEYERENLDTSLETVLIAVDPANFDTYQPKPRVPSWNEVKGFHVRVGRLDVEVEVGDITEENTDAIVNSSNVRLTLGQGAISKAIYDAAGEDVAEEAHTKKNMEKMKSEELVVTGPGRLMTRHIMHVKAKSSKDGWKRITTKCLQEAERRRLKSISFPALGTGMQGFSDLDICKAMFTAFSEFSACKPSHLLRIRIVLYDASKMPNFQTAATKDQHNAQRPFEGEPQADAFLVNVYATDRSKVQEIATNLNAILGRL